jgi:hypothetical protein
MAGVVAYEYADHIDEREMERIKKCFAEYDDVSQRWAPYDAQYRARFAAIKKIENYYEMREALAKLAEAYFADLKATKLNVQGAMWDMLGESGLTYEARAYVLEQHRKRGIRLDSQDFQGVFPPITDDTLAGDIYCVRSDISFGKMLPKPRQRAVDDYETSAKKANEDLVLPKQPGISHTNGMIGSNGLVGMKVPAGTALEIWGIVDRINKTSNGVEIRAQFAGAQLAVWDCAGTDKVESVDASGTVHYRQACRQGAQKYQIIYNVTFPDVPAALKKGDRIDFEGTAKATSKLSADQSKTTLDVAGAIIRGVRRGKAEDSDQWGVVATY